MGFSRSEGLRNLHLAASHLRSKRLSLFKAWCRELANCQDWAPSVDSPAPDSLAFLHATSPLPGVALSASVWQDKAWSSRRREGGEEGKRGSEERERKSLHLALVSLSRVLPFLSCCLLPCPWPRLFHLPLSLRQPCFSSHVFLLLLLPSSPKVSNKAKGSQHE